MKHLIHKASTAGAAIAGALLATPAFAQTTNFLTEVASENTGLGSQSFTEILGSIISVVLSFLGVVLLILVIFSGIQWMTAGGDSGKVDEAKTRIINATIGLVLVLAALAISQFVFDTLLTATGSSVAPSGTNP